MYCTARIVLQSSSDFSSFCWYLSLLTMIKYSASFIPTLKRSSKLRIYHLFSFKDDSTFKYILKQIPFDWTFHIINHRKMFYYFQKALVWSYFSFFLTLLKTFLKFIKKIMSQIYSFSNKSKMGWSRFLFME